MNEVVVVDIGGTHARFAIASIADDGAIILDDPATLRARIQLRVELARDLNPETLDYLLAHQRIAALEHQLAAMEGKR